MPDVDGIELLRHLRGNESFAAVPVVSAHVCYSDCASHYANSPPSPCLLPSAFRFASTKLHSKVHS